MSNGWGDAWGVEWAGASDDVPTIIAGTGGAPNLAIDVQPDTSEGTFTLDESELDGPDLLSWGDEGWVNVVCNVTRVRIVRGASQISGPLTRAEAAVVNVEVLDHDRRFDPLVNADAVHAGTPIRVRAWAGTDPDHPLWSAVLVTGEIDDVPVTYQRSDSPYVSINASDVLAELVRWSAVGRAEPVGAGDNLRQRVARIMTEANIPTSRIAPDSDTGFAVTLTPSALASGWDDIEEAQLAELGRVWVDRENRIVVRGRGSQLSGPVRGTLSDWHGEVVDEYEPHVCYTDLAALLGTDQLINRTIGQRQSVVDGDDPPVLQRDDTWSQARYRTRVGDGDQRSLAVQNDTQVADWCEALLLSASRPELRVDRVGPAPWAAGGAAWQAVLSTDIGDRWATRYHPAIGPTVMRTVGVLGIEHEITPEGWSVVWHLAPAATPGETADGYFTLDVSELDSGDVLSPFRGSVAV